MTDKERIATAAERIVAAIRPNRPAIDRKDLSVTVPVSIANRTTINGRMVGDDTPLDLNEPKKKS